MTNTLQEPIGYQARMIQCNWLVTFPWNCGVLSAVSFHIVQGRLIDRGRLFEQVRHDLNEEIS